MAKIGIQFGNFDPIHMGHIETALAVRQALKLDNIIICSDGNAENAHFAADGTDRRNMTESAAGEYGLTACDADALCAFRNNHSEDTFIYILGADAECDFPMPTMRTEFAIVGRDSEENRKHAEELRRKYGVAVRLADVAVREISSAQVRALAAEGKDVSEFVPKSVAEYIDKNGVYLTGMCMEEVRRRLSEMLPEHRWKHTLGVADTARELAVAHNLHPARAYLAGLLHDAAKPLPYDALRRLSENIADVDEEEMNCEPALHAPVSAVLAYRDFGVRCAEILSAIRKHTLGGADMSPFEALIYVSDFIEPNRKPFDGLEEARRAAKKDILAAARLCAKFTVEYVRMRGGSVHPRTLQML